MLECREITSRSDWDAFLAVVQPDTFLQMWEWGVCNAASGTKISHVGIYSGQDLVAIALILKTTARRGSFLFCPHGPIIRSRELGLHVMTCLTEYLKKVGRAEGVSFIRMSPILEDIQEYCKVFKDLGFRPAPIHLMHPELAWIIDIRPSEDEILAGMRKNTRYAVKKAAKDGVTVEFGGSEFLDQFWELYRATFTRQHFVPFSKEYLRRELSAFGSNVFIGVAKYQGEVVSGAVIVANSWSGFYHHGASNQKFSKLTASHLLQWEIIRKLKAAGCVKYNFWGIAPENMTKHPWAGLSLFKKGFGGSSYAYIHAQDLVLSPKYAVTYIIEKLRRLKRGL